VNSQAAKRIPPRGKEPLAATKEEGKQRNRRAHRKLTTRRTPQRIKRHAKPCRDEKWSEDPAAPDIEDKENTSL
jgi:hypothetical protein